MKKEQKILIQKHFSQFFSFILKTEIETGKSLDFLLMHGTEWVPLKPEMVLFLLFSNAVCTYKYPQWKEISNVAWGISFTKEDFYQNMEVLKWFNRLNVIAKHPKSGFCDNGWIPLSVKAMFNNFVLKFGYLFHKQSKTPLFFWKFEVNWIVFSWKQQVEFAILMMEKRWEIGFKNSYSQT